MLLVGQRRLFRVLPHNYAAPAALPLLPVAIVPTEPITKPAEPSRNASDEIWAAYHEQMAVWHHWRADVEHWRKVHDQRLDVVEQRQDALEYRMEGVEELSRLFIEVTERLGPQTLTPEHQSTVKNAVRHLSELTGAHFQTIYADLNETFHVAKYDQIPEARWLEVFAWLKSRIDAAEKRRKH